MRLLENLSDSESKEELKNAVLYQRDAVNRRGVYALAGLTSAALIVISIFGNNKSSVTRSDTLEPQKRDTVSAPVQKTNAHHTYQMK